MIPALLLALAQADDRSALVAGVQTLVARGALPGAMVASKEAFVVMKAGDVPLFVAAKVGAGRAVAGGHESFFSAESLQNPDNARFLRNALAWLGRGSADRLRVGALDMPGLAERAGGNTVSIRKEELAAGLTGLDVLAMTQGALDNDPKAQDAVVAWTKAGHGLLVVGPAWGWQQIHPNRSLARDQAANRMLLPFGIGFSAETAEGRPAPAGDDPLLATDSALAALRKGGLGPDATARATGTVERALALTPMLGDEIKALAAAEGGAEGPTPAHPITRSMPFSRLWARVQAHEFETGSSNAKAASASDFPGAVPADAPRVERSVTVDTAVPGWHGTGLYAAPGETVIVRVARPLADQGLGVRIGPQTDTLWHLDKWERFPEISLRTPLQRESITLSSPFGGTIFVDVPRRLAAGKIQVEIAHAVPAIRYVRGQTSAPAWSKMLAEDRAPWVEMEGRRVILSLPRAAVEGLADPAALMAYWDEMMDLCFAFYAAPPREKPERYCVDRQISAGYMHSGYPIMTFEDVEKTFADVAKLRGKGASWGFYHEMGHNFQEGDWTFEGTGEVTNNLFSLYASEKLNGVTPDHYEQAHPAMSKEAQRTRLAAYLAAGAPFEKWQSDPFLALTLYAQLREAFGWEPFTRVFGEYRTLAAKPSTDLAKHDEWMVRMARATGRNLGPFFTAWGVPTSAAARASIASLPGWMPADWPGK